MADGIFARQDIGGGDSALTPMNAVSDQSDVTKIEGARSLGNLFTIAGKIAEGSEEDKAAQTLANFRQTAIDLANAKESGRYTNQQASQKFLEVSQTFVNQNPHLREDVDKIAKDLKGTYDFFDKTVGSGSEIDKQYEKDVAAAVTEFLPPSQKDDPQMQQQAYLMWQQRKALLGQIDLQSKQIALSTAKINQIKGENDVAQMPVDNALKALQLEDATNKNAANKTYSSLVGIGVQGAYADVATQIERLKQDPNNSALRAEVVKTLLAAKTNAESVFTQSQNIPYLDSSLISSGKASIGAIYDNAVESLSGAVDLKQMQTDSETLVMQEKLFLQLKNEQGLNINRNSALLQLLGNSPALSYQLGTDTLKVLETTPLASGYGEDVKPIWATDKGTKEANKLYNNSLLNATRAYNINPKAPSAEKQKDIIAENLYSYYNSALKSQNGSLEERQQGAYEFVNSFGSSRELERLVQTNPEVVSFDPSFRKSFKTMINTSYGTPAFQSVVKTMEDSLKQTKFYGRGATGTYEGKPISESIEMYWDNGVQVRPKAGVPPGQVQYLNDAINSVKKNLPVLTNVVRASALVDGSVDYERELEAFKGSVFGMQVNEAVLNRQAQPKPQEENAEGIVQTEPGVQDAHKTYSEGIPLPIYDDVENEVVFANKETLKEFLNMEGNDMSEDDKKYFLRLFDDRKKARYRMAAKR